MTDQPLSTAELECLVQKAEEYVKYRDQMGSKACGPDWPAMVAAVCRTALAQAKKIERLEDFWSKMGELWSRDYILAEEENCRLRESLLRIAARGGDWSHADLLANVAGALRLGVKELETELTKDEPCT